MWHEYIVAGTLEEALAALSSRAGRARIVAGATDLMLELERGARPGVDTLIDITRIPGLDGTSVDAHDLIHLGPMVTHNQCAASALIRERGFPLARAAWEVGAPQIRNRGTVAGNLITASPANDTITPLIALGAQVTMRSMAGERTIPLSEFYTGVRKTVMNPDEILVDIAFPAMKTTEHGTFIKLALRRAQAISVVNVAVKLETAEGHVRTAAIALGSVAPTIIRATEAEAQLAGKSLSDEAVINAARLAMKASRPIDDLRGSAAYRAEMVRVCTERALRALGAVQERETMPADPVTLSARQSIRQTRQVETASFPRATIKTRINGKTFSFSSGHDKSLLRLLREDACLTGTKEGCAEGECGACTVFLDGDAVMACMVPAPRAHGADIVTIEGLAQPAGDRAAVSGLHPVQQAFIDAGAVQCGYCTPGFIMSAAKLLEERTSPTVDEIEQAITGNLCRCTGYYKIVRAVELAAGVGHEIRSTQEAVIA